MIMCLCVGPSAIFTGIFFFSGNILFLWNLNKLYLKIDPFRRQFASTKPKEWPYKENNW